MRNPYDWYITPEEYEAAAANGISKRLLENRIRRYGWPKDRAMTEPPRRRSKIPHEIVEQARRNGIPLNTLYWRLWSGWPPERAATEPPMARAEAIEQARECRRRIAADLVDFARQHGVSYWVLWKRIKRGWDPEMAATTPVGVRMIIERR